MAVKTPAQQKAYEDQIMAAWNKSKATEAAASTANPALVQQHQQTAEAFKQANWQNGGTTVTPTTGAQNLNTVIGQAGNTVGQSANIQGIQAQAAKDTAAQNTGIAGGDTPVYTPPTGNVDTTPMNQALQQLPTYIPPASTGLNFDQAKGQVAGQIDPMFQRALEALQAQKYQDQLNGDQLGMARGGSHSGLAADLQNKVAIAAAGKASDLDATRQTQIAQMAQDLVNRGQDNDFRNKQAALAEYLGINGLNLQAQGQQADYTGIYKGMQTLAAQNQGFNQSLETAKYGLDVKQQHIDLANKLTELFGVKVNPTSDPMQSYAQVAGLSTTAAQKIAADAKQSTFDNAIKLALANNTISQSQANTMYRAQEIGISQQNANTSAANSGNSASNNQQNHLMEIWKATGKAPAGLNGVTEGTAYTGASAAAAEKAQTAETYSKYLDSVAQYTKDPETGKNVLSNPDAVESAILTSGLSEYEMFKAYKAKGLPWSGPIPTPGK